MRVVRHHNNEISTETGVMSFVACQSVSKRARTRFEQ